MKFLKNRTVLGAVCIVLSLLICFALTPLFNQSVSRKTTVVRVVKDIQSGEQITKDMVQTVEVGGYNLPEAVMKKADSVVGKYAKADLAPGDYVLSAKLSDAPAAEKSDEVGATVDYTSVYALVRREVEQKRFLLLEALGSHLAELLLSEWITINEVTVAIRKPAVPLPGQIDYVEVEVSRRR